jgi:hypothetical protein
MFPDGIMSASFYECWQAWLSASGHSVTVAPPLQSLVEQPSEVQSHPDSSVGSTSDHRTCVIPHPPTKGHNTAFDHDDFDHPSHSVDLLQSALENDGVFSVESEAMSDSDSEDTYASSPSSTTSWPATEEDQQRRRKTHDRSQNQKRKRVARDEDEESEEEDEEKEKLFKKKGKNTLPLRKVQKKSEKRS